MHFFFFNIPDNFFRTLPLRLFIANSLNSIKWDLITFSFVSFQFFFFLFNCSRKWWKWHFDKIRWKQNQSLTVVIINFQWLKQFNKIIALIWMTSVTKSFICIQWNGNSFTWKYFRKHDCMFSYRTLPFPLNEDGHIFCAIISIYNFYSSQSEWLPKCWKAITIGVGTFTDIRVLFCINYVN